MKKVIILLSIVALLFVANASYADSPLKKFGRGFSNIITCPLDVVDGIVDAHKENGVIAASTWGVMSGFFRMGGRALCGMYEMVTFVLPPYDPIIKNPEFHLEGWLK